MKLFVPFLGRWVAALRCRAVHTWEQKDARKHPGHRRAHRPPLTGNGTENATDLIFRFRLSNVYRCGRLVFRGKGTVFFLSLYLPWFEATVSCVVAGQRRILFSSDVKDLISWTRRQPGADCRSESRTVQSFQSYF